MLETVKQIIHNSPCISFVEYFANYVMYVQDESINNEVSSLVRNNQLSAYVLNKVINKNLKEFLADDK